MASATSLCNRNIKYHPGAQRGTDAEDVPFAGALLENWPAVALVLGTIIMFRTKTCPMLEAISSSRNISKIYGPGLT